VYSAGETIEPYRYGPKVLTLFAGEKKELRNLVVYAGRERHLEQKTERRARGWYETLYCVCFKMQAFTPDAKAAR